MNERQKLISHALKTGGMTAFWLFAVPCAICAFLYIPTRELGIRIYEVCGAVAFAGFVFQVTRILIQKPRR
jgi:hypothetical protein